MHGGIKVYRGTAAAARHYVEADRSRADDYYLAEGSGVAMRIVAGFDKLNQRVSVEHRADMDGEAYELWVAGIDVESGAPKGRLRKDGRAVRFVEVTVNGPKAWSLAAALHPEIADAYDAAQTAAAEEIIGWLAAHATTRVGPRLHLQINARVATTSTTGGPEWRGLHTVGVRDSLEAINGIGHAAMMTKPAFRAALAAHGFILDAESGEVVELAAYVGAFSARSRQIEANIDTYEAEWRAEHPGEEPGPVLRQAWDRRAWADARPDKVVPTSGEALREHWVEELDELGHRSLPERRSAPRASAGLARP